ncbi:metal cation symporter ZIP14 [Anopheles stephensi]|uniref:metal cation symporter ZIP14 n=1 Tax=Anopheles stephensi TaxID=30069 RepID=UPI001658AB7E|nr:metal cation symporter ZIP14 [Anopheles stephensi]
MASLQKFLRSCLAVLFVVSVSLAGGETSDATVTEREPPVKSSSMPPPAVMPPEYNENKFLKYLFNKYGSKGVISFEGLEHLMHSLGLGGLYFTGSHSLKEHRPDGYDFRDYDIYDGVSQHDHNHHHDDDGDGDASTPEPPVITYANAKVSTGGGDQRPRTSADHHHNHADLPHEPQGQVLTTASSSGAVNRDDRGSSANTTDAGSVQPRSVSTVVQDRSTSDEENDHVWQELIFKDMHDPRHRHPRNKNVPFCLSPMSIVHLVMEEPLLARHHNLRKARSLPHSHAAHDSHTEDEIDPDARIEITPSEFKDLCPAFLVQLDQRACSQKLQKESNPHREKKTFSQAWIYATACVLIISLCGLVGVAMVPLAKSIAYDDILRFLIALGVGTLCGDALMHLLPHALLPHGDDGGEHHHDAHDHGADAELDHHGHEHHSAETRAMWLCLCAFGTAFFMYSLEMILPLFRDGEDAHSHHGHSHAPSSNRVEPKTVPSHTASNNQHSHSGNHHHHHHHNHRGDDIELDMTDGGAKDKEAKTMLQKKTVRKPMAAVAFMVILGDGLHNITDGLAIGAAFAVDPVTGLATSFAILCHELPHELGDFALLLQTGVSIRRAIFLNIVSSVLSFVGMALGLLLTGLHESVVSWIYAGTAGTFLYIALSDLVPEMRNDVAKSEQKLKVILIQLTGLALGAIIMLLIALNETGLRALFD